jgi:hypothetical protein
VSRRGPLVIAGLAAVAGWSGYLWLDEHAPALLVGLTLAGLVLGLLATGFIGGVKGLPLAALAAAAPLVVWWVTFDEPAAEDPPATAGCDPSCGFSLGGALMLAVPLALLLAGIGSAARAALRRARGRAAGRRALGSPGGLG